MSRNGTRLPRISPRAVVRGVPRAAWACALIACLNAICWSLITPPFQVTDEPDHVAYVKQLAETGRLPTSGAQWTSNEEGDVMDALHGAEIIQRPQVRTIATAAEQRELREVLARTSRDPRTGSEGVGLALSEPPLYYALETIPYTIASHGSLLDRLMLMRLFSTLFAALTALFVFLFVREALPAQPWTWSVAGLAIALAPLLGFMSGAVNPDSMLAAVSAATFYALARAFRRGLGMGEAVAIGALMAIGFLTKLNYIGLAPGVLAGLVVLAMRVARLHGRRRAFGRLVLACAIAFSPVVSYAAINALSSHPVLGLVSGAIKTSHGSILSQLNYIWQLYLPRLPGTVSDFPGLFTTRQLWFDGFVGLYGWLDTPFPGWVDTLALIPAGAIVLLCGRSLLGDRAVLLGRAGELMVYAGIALGLLLLVGLDSYRSFPATDAEYAQVRYLMPLLALLGAALALAARGVGRRWGPTVGALIVVLFLAHDIFSQLQVVARYYG
jgi:4-amino-4-deoxy-L-arabinose transferase-like glycosyltransferase